MQGLVRDRIAFGVPLGKSPEKRDNVCVTHLPSHDRGAGTRVSPVAPAVEHDQRGLVLGKYLP